LAGVVNTVHHPEDDASSCERNEVSASPNVGMTHIRQITMSTSRTHIGDFAVGSFFRDRRVLLPT
jgi:hypothetical protein